MEVEEIQAQACKFPRIGNGRNGSGKIGPEEDEDGELCRRGSVGRENQLRGWHNSSRIIRVSRASGGKDRHSKVWTSKGLRDRRVRLSVTTAIQFYDLQDRLGYDQPSKAVEWLIKAAEESISELPALNGSFPETPRHLSEEKRDSDHRKGFDSAEMELDGERENYQQTQNNNNQNQVSLSKSSSTSETSKGSGLSLSRAEVPVNRTKTSRQRAAKDKEKDEHQNVNPVSHNSSSFTELLTGGGNSTTSPAGEANLYHKASRQWSAAAPMDYFGSGLLGPSSSSSRMQAFHLGNSTPYNVAGDGHSELQQFSFVPDHFIPVVSQQPGSGGSDYNLNFTISSSGPGLGSGYNSRGTLQSNSQSFFPHLQRFASPVDGSNAPFLLGTATPGENHHHQHLQQQQHIFYGDSGRLHSDHHKEKEKN